ncbi:uncharacterized protein IWZ02DRAFT_507118 [Phyllosticta citriasiana]|uniref:uncharacterized protein n=1 Tax=Phyllosticta citriasiana TaxID=595635 RepID=UPI0030FD8A98
MRRTCAAKRTQRRQSSHGQGQRIQLLGAHVQGMVDDETTALRWCLTERRAESKGKGKAKAKAKGRLRLKLGVDKLLVGALGWLGLTHPRTGSWGLTSWTKGADVDVGSASSLPYTEALAQLGTFICHQHEVKRHMRRGGRPVHSHLPAQSDGQMQDAPSPRAPRARARARARARQRHIPPQSTTAVHVGSCHARRPLRSSIQALGTQGHYSAGAVCVPCSPLQPRRGEARNASRLNRRGFVLFRCVDYISPEQARPDGRLSVAQAANDYFQAFKSSHAQSPCRTVPYRTADRGIALLNLCNQLPAR